ncbi:MULTISPECIES: serine/threonine protein kinase [unclassified Exiguobacterium]|uniref:serine/threonine protein kinase n=1 Tax=unclassified Exiguobacterium TaxID=2644629 RepID=UPI001BEAA251|nr:MULTISPECIES: serine/threonine protein kinase [unclassified Exiguobacterium]
MNDEFRSTELPKWEKMIKSLFGGELPLRKEWSNYEDIIKILDTIGKNEAENHTFLPNGGGLDLSACTNSKENSCIELNLDSTKHIVKPEKLVFQRFEDGELEWSYFFLETDELKPSGVYEDLLYSEEELVELFPGEYIDRYFWDTGYYNGDVLSKDARLVSRHLNGSFVIFSKASLYNANSSTYDGRHSKLKEERFKNHIQEVVLHLNNI